MTPTEGAHSWWSGRGDELSNTLTRTLTLAAGQSATVSADLWYSIEDGYDFLYAEYSTDGGARWTQLGKPITGEGPKWAGKKWTLKATTAGEVTFRFRYATDGGVNEAGAFLDNISTKVGQSILDTEGAEGGTSAWTAKGWKASTGTEVTNAARYYLIENRQYVGYDHTLKVGPYQFSKAFTAPDWVERFPFQDGMLVWLVDQGYTDNNVITHPGAGYALPVDARPDSLTYPDGSSPTNRREPFDATFGLDAVDAVCLHKEVATKAKGTDDDRDGGGVQLGRRQGGQADLRRHQGVRVLRGLRAAELGQGGGRGRQGDGRQRGRRLPHGRCQLPRQVTR